MNTVLVVGAGLSGLLVAERLKGAGLSVSILEKSKALGGRMATRRLETARLDHGAQFIKATSSDLPAWSRLAKKWANVSDVPYYAPPTGMTAIAKDLAAHLDIQFEKLVTHLTRRGSRWEVTIENSPKRLFDYIYLTCPLPQTLQILKNSSLNYPAVLNEIKYAKALVGLFTFESAPSFLPDLCLDPNENIAIIANQQAKEVSQTPAFTFTMSPAWSETRFDLTEAELLDMMVKEISTLYDINANEFSPTLSQVKKWRYSHPHRTEQTPKAKLYCELDNGLYLIGDAFGGGSLKGAARSAESVPLPQH